jgi:serine/threonine-protein kinase RsbW
MQTSGGGTAVVPKGPATAEADADMSAAAEACVDRIELTAVPSAVRQARRWAAGRLAQSDPPPAEDLIETAVLLVSELITNAIRAVGPDPDLERHPGRDQISLLITPLPAAVRIEVHDHACGSLPPPLDGGADSETGRGLMVIAALSRRWGWQPGPRGKVVWCELSL